MANERIKANMDVKEVLLVMADGNPGALTCMVNMLNSYEEAILYLLYFDSMEIYGEKIYMLWNDCCDRDMQKFKKTIQYLQSGKVSREEIHKNLERPRAEPFI